jgi:hypothetical protein
MTAAKVSPHRADGLSGAATCGAAIPPGGPAFSSHSAAVPHAAPDSARAVCLAAQGAGATYAAAPAHVRAFIALALRNMAGRR